MSAKKPIVSKDGAPLRQPIAEPRADRHRLAPNWPQEVRVDPGYVTRDLAVELMLHHLQLARAYFEATPDDMGTQAVAEAYRMFGQAGADITVAKAFIAAANEYYEGLEKKDA